MDKKKVYEIFGGRSGTAEAAGVTPQAISIWPDELDQALTDRVIGMAWRAGKLRRVTEAIRKKERSQ